jgi:hypothetical protein
MTGKELRRAGVTALVAVLVSAGVVTAQTQATVPMSAGVDLPLPYGFGFSVYRQSQPYAIDRITLGIPGVDPALLRGIAVKNTTETAHLTFDYWALPFLDLAVLAGYLRGTTDVNLASVNVGVPLSDIEVTYKGLVYGGSFTLVGGWDKFFGTLTTQYTSTHLDTEQSSVTAWVVTPKFGYRFGKTAAWLGAMYQNPDEKHKGTTAVPYFGNVPYDVTLSAKDKWGYLAGLTTGFSEHWLLTLEGGFGKRTSGLVHLDYRF